MGTVDEFIAGIRSFDKHGDVSDAFLNGYCYQFAVILQTRFPQAEIWYEYLDGHFLTEIDGRLYDIRGDVTERYPERKFYAASEYTQRRSIVDGCILKI